MHLIEITSDIRLYGKAVIMRYKLELQSHCAQIINWYRNIEMFTVGRKTRIQHSKIKVYGLFSEVLINMESIVS